MEGELYYAGILILCLVFSAVFSAAETALTSVPESFIRQIIEEKRHFTNPFSLWLLRPNSVLTTIIVGNNLVNTLAAVVATVMAQHLFSHFVISISTGVVTLLLLIVGEITPKTFARHNAKKVVMWVIYIIYPIYFLLYPLVSILSRLSVFFIHSMGGKTKRVDPMATEEEITYMIRLGHEEGVFNQEHGEMLESIIDFRDTEIREIIIPRTDICSLPIDMPFEDLIKEIMLHGYTRWPIYENDIDHVVGILYVKDLINYQLQGGQKFHLRDHLRKPLFIPESMKLDAVLKEFQKQKVHLGIVVDEYGGTAGIVTLEDILEEIVGEIRDELDKEEEEQTVRKIGEGHFLVSGRTSILDLEKQANIILPQDESYESVAGFLVSKNGKIPEKDTVINYDGYAFRVAEVEEKRVIMVEIKKIDENP